MKLKKFNTTLLDSLDISLVLLYMAAADGRIRDSITLGKQHFLIETIISND